MSIIVDYFFSYYLDMTQRRATPPPLQGQGPTAKEKRYDRQLRLWAASGQEALENAKILLLNSGPGVVGVETLKNLILPGIGSFTIVDEAEVAERDLGVNFFLDESSLGRPRSEESCKLLKELNPEVQGHAIRESIASYVEKPLILQQFSLILLIGPSSSLATVSETAKTHSVPLFYIHSIGFYSHFSVQLPSQFPIVDTHPDPASTHDLRLLNPWQELSDFMHEKTAKLDSLDDHQHGHIPYLLLLLHFLEKWKASHAGDPPSNYAEKKEFKTMVEKGARTHNSEGGEENFDEAAAAVLKSLNPPYLSSGLREVFESEDCRNLTALSANFWIIAHALRDFHSAHGLLPVPGAVPDMKAQSVDYISVQNIYKDKARKDIAEVTAKVRSAQEKCGSKALAVDEKEIEAFCKGAAFVKLFNGRPIRIASNAGSFDWRDGAKTLCQELQDEESLLPTYIAFQVLDRSPKTVGDSESSSYASALLKDLAKAGGVADLDFERIEGRIEAVSTEMRRADGAELHNISALTGGMVAQEVIKVITKQYVPVDNTCIFDGITSKTAVFKI